jgi:arylsulfatase A-like enzyme
MVGKWGLGAPTTEGVPNRQGFDFFYGYNCQRQAHTYYPMHLWRNEERVLLNNENVAPHANLEEGADPNDPASYARFQLNDYAPDLMHQEALQFMADNKEQPFFLYYASPIPHVPLQAPQEWVEYYKDKIGPEEPFTGTSYFPNQTPLATYAAMISYLDEQVGDLITQLKTLGLYENTLVIFTSDNGPTYTGGTNTPYFESAHPFKTENGRIKGTVYEGGIRVPMIASWPGHIEAGSESDHISVFYDFMPTFGALTGVSVPETADGISLLPTLRGETQPQHEFLYWEFPAYNGQQAVRMGKWKGIRQNIFDGPLETALYDLETDPQEQTNIADQHPDVLQRIEAVMLQEHVPSTLERFKFPQLGDL